VNLRQTDLVDVRQDDVPGSSLHPQVLYLGVALAERLLISLFFSE
jgi:hypothetical protein